MGDLEREPRSLPSALVDYYEARTAWLSRARRVLRVNELDARALVFIARHPGTRPRQLIDILGISSAGVTTLTDRLISRQLVRRDTLADDRRAVLLTAVVDIESPPWSQLTAFDRQIERPAQEVHGTSPIADLIGSLIDDATSTNE